MKKTEDKISLLASRMKVGLITLIEGMDEILRTTKSETRVGTRNMGPRSAETRALISKKLRAAWKRRKAKKQAI